MNAPGDGIVLPEAESKIIPAVADELAPMGLEMQWVVPLPGL
jgi:hypothetical protein